MINCRFYRRGQQYSSSSVFPNMFYLRNTNLDGRKYLHKSYFLWSQSIPNKIAVNEQSASDFRCASKNGCVFSFGMADYDGI